MNASSHRFRLRLGVRVLLSCSIFAAAGACFGQTLWTAGTGNWNTLGNWTLGVPNSASGTAFDARIDNGGAAELMAPGASVRRLRVGTAAGGGHLEVSGGQLTVTDNFHLNEGGANFASTRIQLGGTITAPATVVGHSGTNASHFSIIGAESRLNATSRFVVGQAGRGFLMLTDGGTLAIGNGTLPLEIATSAGSLGAVFIGQGFAAGMLEASAVQFGAGSGVLDFNHAGDLTFAMPIAGAGMVNRGGSGTTTLAATNSYAGSTYIYGRTLAISADENLGTPPGVFTPGQLQFGGGALRATESFALAATRGISFNSSGGTIEVDDTKKLTYPNNLDLLSGTLTKTGAGSLELKNLRIGTAGGGMLVVTGGGALSTDSSWIVSGSATVRGPLTSWTMDDLDVGFAARSGTLEIVNAGTVTTTNSSSLTSHLAATGTVTVRGAGSTWNIGEDLDVGSHSTLNIEDQALVHIADTVSIAQGDITQGSTRHGTVNLSGGTLRFNHFSRAAAAIFNFNSGTIQLAGDRSVGSDAIIAEFFGAVPAIPTGKGLAVEGAATLTTMVTIDGGTLSVGQLINRHNLRFQRGTFNITNQAVTIGSAGPLGDALDVDNGMTVNVTLGITNQGLVTGDGQIGGTFHNAATGELRAQPGRSLTLTGVGNTNDGQIKLFGGELDFDADLTNKAGASIAGNGSLITGGLTNHGTMNFAGTANIVGDVTNAAGGKVISSGGGATIFFDDVKNDGEIRTSSNGFTVFFGDVAGAGAFTGTGTVNFEGDVAPGNSPAAVQFAGDVIFGPDATLQIELGGASPGEYDQIDVAGELTLSGALELSLIDGFTPSAGQTFEILNWGRLVGAFSSVLVPSVEGLVWDTSQLAAGVLRVASAMLPGDYNNNGVVDAADYTVWRDHLGSGTALPNDESPEVGPDDYNRWKANFDQTAGAGSLAFDNADVPEPATIVLLMFATAGWSLRRLRAAYKVLTTH